MEARAATGAAPADPLAAVRAELAAKPEGVLETIARAHDVPLKAVVDCLDSAQAVAVSGTLFHTVWSELAAWGEVMFIVHSRDGVFEIKGALPPGSEGRGYFNIHGDGPIGGHLRAERCRAIYFVDRPFFGRRSCSVQFFNPEGETMFKVFVRRDAARELDAGQLARFEALRARLREEA